MIFLKNKVVLKINNMKWQNHIQATEGVVGGRPAIKGTRIAVDLILEKLSIGDTIPDLLEAYPHITKDAIFACLAYAARDKCQYS
jgi:uncharacterized protein (DUF433 family)